MQNLPTSRPLLDPVAPLIRILKVTQKDQREDFVCLENERAAITDALRMLGNVCPGIEFRKYRALPMRKYTAQLPQTPSPRF